MNRASAKQFQRTTQKTSAALHPGTITIDGTTYSGGVTREPHLVEQDDGGIRPLDGITASISKSYLTEKLAIGTIIVDDATNRELVLFEVIGANWERWILKAALFPK